MTLEELETRFLARTRQARERQVIVSLNLGEDTIRALGPRLSEAGLSLSEFTRRLIDLRLRQMGPSV